MTDLHPGTPTNPARVGAPLPDHLAILPPTQFQDIVDELDRAEVELLYAAAKHRKAWANVRALNERITGEGGYPDSDLTYKKATGDVTWWRGEMATQAAAISALRGMRDDRLAGTRTDGTRPLDYSRVDTTSPGGAASSMPRHGSAGSSRTQLNIVLAWQPEWNVTDEQADAARSLLKNRFKMPLSMIERCSALLLAYNTQLDIRPAPGSDNAK